MDLKKLEKLGFKQAVYDDNIIRKTVQFRGLTYGIINIDKKLETVNIYGMKYKPVKKLVNKMIRKRAIDIIKQQV